MSADARTALIAKVAERASTGDLEYYKFDH
jgi:hypothetical protein